MKKSPEAKITPKIMRWFTSTNSLSSPFEIKHTKGEDNFQMSKLSKHQRDYLLAATTKKGMIWKIPDANIGYIPFDCIHYKNSRAYVVIVYSQLVVAIHIIDILQVKTPSLHVNDAKEMAHFTGLLSKLN